MRSIPKAISPMLTALMAVSGSFDSNHCNKSSKGAGLESSESVLVSNKYFTRTPRGRVHDGASNPAPEIGAGARPMNVPVVLPGAEQCLHWTIQININHHRRATCAARERAEELQLDPYWKWWSSPSKNVLPKRAC